MQQFVDLRPRLWADGVQRWEARLQLAGVLKDISDRATVCTTVRNMPAQVELSNRGNFPQKRDV